MRLDACIPQQHHQKRQAYTIGCANKMFHEAASCRIFGELPSVATTKFTADWPFSLLGGNVAS
jgi:hypothetical protein